MKDLITGLLAINCKYTNKPQANGRCYSNECMLNQHEWIAKDIKEKGCKIWTKLPNL